MLSATLLIVAMDEGQLKPATIEIAITANGFLISVSQKYNNYYALIESMILSFKITYVPSSHYNHGQDIMDQNFERKTNND